jgi:geranylgeranyl pyrophosphate synthase
MQTQSKAQEALSILQLNSLQSRIQVLEESRNQKLGLKKYDEAIENYFTNWDDCIRQGLVSIVFEAVGSKSTKIVPLQVALTFIDATMDIHDDIIDDSLKKKKAKTVYGKLGKTPSLLLGDLLLVKGFYLLHNVIEELPREKQALIMHTTNSFLSEVVKAHIAEANLKLKKWTMKPQEYFDILKQKAAEIEGRMKIAAILGGGTESEVYTLSEYGRSLGTLLAIRSEYTDLFDIGELSNRVKSECLPLHILFAIQKKPCQDEIFSLLSKSNLKKQDINDLLELVIQSKGFSDLNKQLKDMQETALQKLMKLKNNQGKESLRLIMTSILEDM